MAKQDFLKPGRYSVEATLRMDVDVDEEDELTEDNLLCDCRRNGEMVDWDVSQ